MKKMYLNEAKGRKTKEDFESGGGVWPFSEAFGV